jgi:hypothetical protein
MNRTGRRSRDGVRWCGRTCLSLFLSLAWLTACSTEPTDVDVAVDRPAAADGELDCDERWAVQGTPNSEAEGFGSSEEAVIPWLQIYSERYDLPAPQVVWNGVASIQDELGDEVLVATALKTEDRGWLPVGLSGCSSYGQLES